LNAPEIKPVEMDFQLDGFLHVYPVSDGYKSGFLGYSSDMVNLALVRDDPAAFVHFMRLAGCDRTSRTFDGCSMEFYCKKRQAVKCLGALAQLEPTTSP
jgi:hypothetical protein